MSVTVAGKLSPAVEITSRVPQESVLSLRPLQFLIYIKIIALSSLGSWPAFVDVLKLSMLSLE